MEFYPKKPIRIDYFPKTKEDTDKSEELKVEDDLDKGPDCNSTDEKESTIKEITKCDDHITEDVKIVNDGAEGDIEKVFGDIENVMEEIAEDKEDKEGDQLL